MRGKQKHKCNCSKNYKSLPGLRSTFSSKRFSSFLLISGLFRHDKRLVVDQCLCVRHSITCKSSHIFNLQSQGFLRLVRETNTHGNPLHAGASVCNNQRTCAILRVHLFTSSVKSTVSPVCIECFSAGASHVQYPQRPRDVLSALRLYEYKSCYPFRDWGGHWAWRFECCCNCRLYKHLSLIQWWFTVWPHGIPIWSRSLHSRNVYCIWDISEILAHDSMISLH